MKHRSSASVSASLGGGSSAAGGGLGAHLRSFDLYRKIPRDLTEGTAFGGTVSILFGVCFLLLFYFEVRNFLSVKGVTSIEVDHSEDAVFQMNFNLTFHSFRCEYLAVDVENIIGRKRKDIGDNSLHKYALDGTFQGKVNDAAEEEWEHLYDGTDKDVYGVKRYAIELDDKTFVSTIDKFEVVLVDFHAPWCPHCRNLAPVFEHAAHLVRERAPHQVDGHHKHSIALASFDCTVPNHKKLCIDNHIQAFPTILVFRQSKNNIVTGRRGKYLEEYNGARQAEAIAKFAISVLQQVQSTDKDALPVPNVGHDVEKDGKPESRVSRPGCRIEGFLMLQRVPGRVIIHPKGSGNSFETGLLKLDHSIKHLSFGKRKPAEIRNLVPESMEGAYSELPGRPVILQEGVEEVPFTSTEASMTHEHYIKVISTLRVPRSGSRIQAYEYTIASNVHDAEEIPSVVFSYDLSPMKVVVREEAKPWIEGFTSMCAILGGVYTCSVLLEGVLSAFVFGIAKKLD